ncbi:SDR family oxidoreductase [Cryptosporangium minutisporangium]|uniref:NAD(P)H-binding protein n=1 Tax=Cryptosporangium minutisporangium TaxID=113569 RepID=A0ABP6SXD2_9ACTN
MDVLVVGGTGAAGRAAAVALAARGHHVRALSRSGTTDVPGATGYRGDLSTGAGLKEAMTGVDAVVDTYNVTSQSYEVARKAFVGATERLLAAEEAAGVRHHVLLSIVAIDGSTFGYYRAKVAQEGAVAGGSVPYTILRATQFHEFAGQLADRIKLGPLVAVPSMVTRPVAVSEVGEALADAVEAGPSGRAPDLHGPRVENVVDMARRTLKARGQRGIVVPLRLPGSIGRMMRSGQLGGTDGVAGVLTFDEWLRRGT